MIPPSFGSFDVQAGAKVNISAGGATPLHVAADNGSTEIINCLLKAGADPNVTDEVSPLLSLINYNICFTFISCSAPT